MWKIDVDFRLLLPLLIGVFMGALDMTILAPALPQIGDSLGVTPAAVVLAFSFYAALYAVAVPVMSKLADVRGYKPVYQFSMFLFAAGSALAALAPTLPVLVLARIVQAIGGGGLFPVAQAIAGAALPTKTRGQVLGLLMGAFAIGGVLGPNLGGFLVQQLNWHWIFWINVPLGIVGVLLLTGIDLPDMRRPARIDWAGTLLIALTFGSFVLGIEGLRHLDEYGFASPRIGGLLALSSVGLLLLVPVEGARKEPILNFKVIASPEVGPLLMVSLLVGFSLLCGIVFVPLYVQLLFRATTMGSGAVLNAAAGGLAVSGWVAGSYTARLGGRRLVIGGMASTAAGIGLMILLKTSLWGLLGGLVFLGAGLGLAQGPLSYLALDAVSQGDRGQVSGLISLTRSLGGAIGITLAGVLLGRASGRMTNRITGEDAAELGVDVWGSSSSLRALSDAPPELQELIRQSLGNGIVYGWYLALGAAVIGLLFSFALRQPEPRLAD